MSKGVTEVRVGDVKGTVPGLDNISGHEALRRAMEVALVGGHPMAVIYGPGSSASLMVEQVAERVRAYGIPFHALAMAPCPCGNYGDARRECRCEMPEVERHLELLARRRNEFDMFLDVGSPSSWTDRSRPEPFSETVARVEAARRLSVPKARSGGDMVKAFEREYNPGAVVMAKVEAVAVSVARLDMRGTVEEHHWAEAMQYSSWACAVLRNVVVEGVVEARS